jgi:hypothetical protein
MLPLAVTLPRAAWAIRPRSGFALVLAAGLLCLALAGPELREIALAAMADAYLEVGVFVGATLLAFYALERRYGAEAGDLIRSKRSWHVPVAALLGALPGCGGAVVVVTQFLRGGLSFGAVVAVLAAGMGDAAFLLLAQAPGTALLVLAVAWCVGVTSGYVVDALHGPDFLRPRSFGAGAASPARREKAAAVPNGLWLALSAAGLLVAMLQLMRFDVDALFGPAAPWRPSLWLGVAGAAVALFGWMRSSSGSANPLEGGGVVEQTICSTNFIVVWVLASLLLYELALHASGADLKAMFEVWTPLMPAMAALVGFIPGCGPQIVVTALYLAGAVPLSAQIANAISNDGDALFPAIALAPRAALVATLYGAVPALAAGYGWQALFE